MRIRHLIAFLLVVGLGATGAMATTWTVYPTAADHDTGTTDFATKTTGEILFWGGATTGSVRKTNGYAMFDITSIPDASNVSSAVIHYYVNNTYFPYYSITPVSLDPGGLGASPDALWNDIEAEKSVGYYVYRNEGTAFGPGWHSWPLEGTGVDDVLAALSQDWFALGFASRDSTATYFTEVDGNDTANQPYLVVADDPENVANLTCTYVPGDGSIDLAWSNRGLYDSIEVYENDISIATLAASAESYNVAVPTAGPPDPVYKVCGVAAAVEYCSADCSTPLDSCTLHIVDLGQITCPAGVLTATGDTTGATDFCEDANGDHHYQFEVVATGTYEISLCATLWDTRLYLYDDTCCGNEIGYDDDACDGPGSGLASVITATLDAGVYYVLVGGFSANEGLYDLAISCTYLPPSDLSCVEGLVSDVDLAWTNNDTYDSVVVYENDILIATLAGTATSYNVALPGDTTLTYRVCGVVGAVEFCSEDCSLTLGSCNDVLVDLGALTCPGLLTASGDTTGALDYCADANGDHHYSFTLASTEEVTIGLCDTAWDTRLYLYDDECCGNQIGYDDDGCDVPNSLASVIVATLDAGTYYVLVGGYSANEGAYDLEITCGSVAAPTGLTCVENGADVDLAWTNNDTYDSVVVYEDDILIDTLAGTAETYTQLGVTKGGHVYRVCGVVSSIEFCSNDCSGIYGYDNVDVLWDFEADDGGFVTDGTTGWQWGAPTYGPCTTTSNVWGVNLDGTYDNNLCLELDTPIIDMGEKGGFLCIDHCYQTEVGYDGGNLWFTTNGTDYVLYAPMEGYDGEMSFGSCPYTYGAGIGSFNGDSLGWVTDCWELTDQDFIDYGVGVKFAFGSDSSNIFLPVSGWYIDNVTVYRNMPTDVYSCDYTVLPSTGTLAFGVSHRITLTNVLSGTPHWTRRIAARIDVTLGNGVSVSNWKSGYTPIGPGASFVTSFPVNFALQARFVGTNTFELITEDVTPAPYNQPPYPASGTTCTVVNDVVASAP